MIVFNTKLCITKCLQNHLIAFSIPRKTLKTKQKGTHNNIFKKWRRFKFTALFTKYIHSSFAALYVHWIIITPIQYREVCSLRSATIRCSHQGSVALETSSVNRLAVKHNRVKSLGGGWGTKSGGEMVLLCQRCSGNFERKSPMEMYVHESLLIHIASCCTIRELIMYKSLIFLSSSFQPLFSQISQTSEIAQWHEDNVGNTSAKVRTVASKFLTSVQRLAIWCKITLSQRRCAVYVVQVVDLNFEAIPMSGDMSWVMTYTAVKAVLY